MDQKLLSDKIRITISDLPTRSTRASEEDLQAVFGGSYFSITSVLRSPIPGVNINQNFYGNPFGVLGVNINQNY